MSFLFIVYVMDETLLETNSLKWNPLVDVYSIYSEIKFLLRRNGSYFR